jgi:hypothetical protein
VRARRAQQFGQALLGQVVIRVRQQCVVIVRDFFFGRGGDLRQPVERRRPQAPLYSRVTQGQTQQSLTFLVLTGTQRCDALL